MIKAWMVAREERHIDDKHWVCLDREDALRIARDVTEYWRNEYARGGRKLVTDKTCRGDQIYHYEVEEGFRVYVVPLTIREKGEADFGLS